NRSTSSSMLFPISSSAIRRASSTSASTLSGAVYFPTVETCTSLSKISSTQTCSDLQSTSNSSHTASLTYLGSDCEITALLIHSIEDAPYSILILLSIRQFQRTVFQHLEPYSKR